MSEISNQPAEVFQLTQNPSDDLSHLEPLNEVELGILMDWMSTPVTAGPTIGALEKHGAHACRVHPVTIHQFAEYRK